MIEVEERIPATVMTYRLKRMGSFEVSILPDVPVQIRGTKVLRVWRRQGELALIEAHVADLWHPVNPRRWSALLSELGD